MFIIDVCLKVLLAFGLVGTVVAGELRFPAALVAPVAAQVCLVTVGAATRFAPELRPPNNPWNRNILTVYTHTHLNEHVFINNSTKF